jgi:exodeoxyribonuclease-5
LQPIFDLGCSGFIVDEASMVSYDIYEDLKSYQMPLIFVGDHGQLEPIGTSFNLMRQPKYTLEEIHRNAGDIANFAGILRRGYKPVAFKGHEDKVRVMSQRNVTDDDLMSVDQVIVAYNRTRVELNQRIRAIQGYTGLLNVGERVICLKNNKKLHLYNGMQGVVKNLYREGKRLMMDFEFDGYTYCGIWYDSKYFNCEKPDFDYAGYDNPNPFDYASAITCHKAQGDEFENVLVFAQNCNKWDMRRWNYTSASRAREWLGWAV